MQAIHHAEHPLQALPEEVQARIDAFDPEGAARVIGPLFSQEPVVGGRRVLGARPAAWRALEDKIIIDALWDAAGVPRAPAEVVPVADAVAAAARLDRGDGTVWAVDNTAGWHGGARGTRRVRDAAEAVAAASWAGGVPHLHRRLRAPARAGRCTPPPGAGGAAEWGPALAGGPPRRAAGDTPPRGVAGSGCGGPRGLHRVVARLQRGFGLPGPAHRHGPRPRGRRADDARVAPRPTSAPPADRTASPAPPAATGRAP